MPSLKMKAKSTKGYLKNGLHICQKSSMICKTSLSHARNDQNAEEIRTYVQTSQDVSLCNKVCTYDVGCEETDNALRTEEDLLQKPQSILMDATIDRLESTSATCASGLQTIFSPILEPTDTCSELRIHCSEGSESLCVPRLEAEESDSSGSSSEYPTCNVSDFHISDLIFSNLPIEGNLVYDQSSDNLFLPDYKCEEPNMFFDEEGEYMALPFLEDTMETGYQQDDRACGEDMSDSNISSLYLAIHQFRSCNQDSDLITYPDSDQAECFDPHMFIRNVPDFPDVAANLRPTILPKETEKKKPITLVLDLDETLVHSTLEHCDDADFTFPVFFNMKEHTVYVRQRPHLKKFLERVAEMFEIIIFTASQSIYAKQLLDILDPEGKLISRRAYRESCIFCDGSYTKDLTVLGVDLAKVVIIDNSPQVFQLQVNNGIPIKSWFDDPSDTALISLLPFLETLVDAEDVRPLVAKRFGNKE